MKEAITVEFTSLEVIDILGGVAAARLNLRGKFQCEMEITQLAADKGRFVLTLRPRESDAVGK